MDRIKFRNILRVKYQSIPFEAKENYNDIIHFAAAMQLCKQEKIKKAFGFVILLTRKKLFYSNKWSIRTILLWVVLCVSIMKTVKSRFSRSYG